MDFIEPYRVQTSLLFSDIRYKDERADMCHM